MVESIVPHSNPPTSPKTFISKVFLEPVLASFENFQSCFIAISKGIVYLCQALLAMEQYGREVQIVGDAAILLMYLVPSFAFRWPTFHIP